MPKLRNVFIAWVSLLLFPACSPQHETIDHSKSSLPYTIAQNLRENCVQCSDTPQTMVEVFFEDTTISECLKAQNIRALVDLETLYCSEQPLISLEGLQHFPNLVKIYVWQAPKVELDFSTLPNLRTVSVKGDDFDLSLIHI